MGNINGLRAMETPCVATAGVSKCPRTTAKHAPLEGGFRVPKQGVSLGLWAYGRAAGQMREQQTGAIPILPKKR